MSYISSTPQYFISHVVILEHCVRVSQDLYRAWSVLQVEDQKLTYIVYLTEFRTSRERESVNLCACNREGNNHSITPELAGVSFLLRKEPK